MSNHKKHKIGDILIQEYNNGSFAYYLDGHGWRNIPSELGKKIIKQVKRWR